MLIRLVQHHSDSALGVKLYRLAPKLLHWLRRLCEAPAAVGQAVCLAGHPDGVERHFLSNEAECEIFSYKLVCLAKHGVERFPDRSLLDSIVGEV